MRCGIVVLMSLVALCACQVAEGEDCGLEIKENLRTYALVRTEMLESNGVVQLGEALREDKKLLRDFSDQILACTVAQGRGKSKKVSLARQMSAVRFLMNYNKDIGENDIEYESTIIRYQLELIKEDAP